MVNKLEPERAKAPPTTLGARKSCFCFFVLFEKKKKDESFSLTAFVLGTCSDQMDDPISERGLVRTLEKGRPYVCNVLRLNSGTQRCNHNGNNIMEQTRNGGLCRGC